MKKSNTVIIIVGVVVLLLIIGVVVFFLFRSNGDNDDLGSNGDNDDLGGNGDNDVVSNKPESNGEYYIIDGPNKLKWLMDNYKNNISDGIPANEAKYLITTNLDMSGFDCTPIGNSENPFSGELSSDGDSITISNMNSGLIGMLEGEEGLISNIYINNGTIIGTEQYMGGICNVNIRGTIEKCGVYGDTSITGGLEVGGICGYNEGTIRGCGVYGNTSILNIRTGVAVGGICGHNEGGDIIVCEAYGTSITGSGYVGGICGINQRGNILGCGAGYDTSISGTIVGGICGHNEGGDIIVCEAYGTSITGDVVVGGICGDNEGNIQNCGAYDGTIIIGEGFWSGGICGRNKRTNSIVQFCGVSGTIINGIDSRDVGGICGHNEGTIQDCGVGDTRITVTGIDDSVGGICGYNSEGTINGNSVDNVTINGTVTDIIIGAGVA